MTWPKTECGDWYGFSWLNKKQKARINAINDDVKCFQYASSVTSNHKKSGKLSIEHQKLSLLYVNKFEKEYINYQEKMTRKFEKYNPTIALNVPKF